MAFPTKNDHFGVWNGGTTIWGTTYMYLIISMIIMMMIMIVAIGASYIIVYYDCSDHHIIYTY